MAEVPATSEPRRIEADDVLPVATPAAGAARVAVVVALNFPQMTVAIAELMTRFTATALQTLVDVGADPVLVDLTGSAVPTVDEVAGCDGVMLLGGGDMDAELYGVTGPVPHEYGVDRNIDAYSMAAVQASLDADRPLLGICRGSQVLNVALGGTLIPDIEDYRLHRGEGGHAVFLEERVRLDPGSRLAGVVGADSLVVRTGHHQAVDQVAPALRAVGWADDGIVEAVEHRERWAIGVQWHPEDSHGSDDDRRRLFGGFVDEVSSRLG